MWRFNIPKKLLQRKISVLPRTKPVMSLSFSIKRLPLEMRRYFVPVRRTDVKSLLLEPVCSKSLSLKPFAGGLQSQLKTTGLDSSNSNKLTVIPHTFSIYQTIRTGGSFNPLSLPKLNSLYSWNNVLSTSFHTIENIFLKTA